MMTIFPRLSLSGYLPLGSSDSDDLTLVSSNVVFGSVRFLDLDLECVLSKLSFLLSHRLALGSMMDCSLVQCFVSESSITVLWLCSLDFLLHARMEFPHLLAVALWNC